MGWEVRIDFGPERGCINLNVDGIYVFIQLHPSSSRFFYLFQ